MVASGAILLKLDEKFHLNNREQPERNFFFLSLPPRKSLDRIREHLSPAWVMKVGRKESEMGLEAGRDLSHSELVDSEIDISMGK